MPTKPFSHPDYHKNQGKCGQHLPCVLCGKAILRNSSIHARVLDGGARFATEEEAKSVAEYSGDMGWYPVGPECARKLRSAGVFLAEMVDES